MEGHSVCASQSPIQSPNQPGDPVGATPGPPQPLVCPVRPTAGGVRAGRPGGPVHTASSTCVVVQLSPLPALLHRAHHGMSRGQVSWACPPDSAGLPVCPSTSLPLLAHGFVCQSWASSVLLSTPSSGPAGPRSAIGGCWAPVGPKGSVQLAWPQKNHAGCEGCPLQCPRCPCRAHLSHPIREGCFLLVKGTPEREQSHWLGFTQRLGPAGGGWCVRPEAPRPVPRTLPCG